MARKLLHEPVDGQPAAIEQDDDRARAGKELQQRQVGGPHAGGAEVEVQDARILVVKALHLALFLGKGGDNARAAQVLLQARVEDIHLSPDGSKERKIEAAIDPIDRAD